jgi:hypothetical protein
VTTPPAPPLVGPCAPWIDAAAVAAVPGCEDIDEPIRTAAAAAASDILWALSGRQFGGECTGYVRPTARPDGWDHRSWAIASGYGWYGSWGTCSYAYGLGSPAWAGHACRCAPAEVELGAYPVRSVSQVKIDGEVIPPDEYRVDNYRTLVRVKAHADDDASVRPGWPTCQRLDLPDTEEGTFSVTFVFGTAPPASGVQAAASLAAEFALLRATDEDARETRLPARVRTLVRQGESITLLDAQDVLDKGRTGIPEVDLFLKSVNGAGLARRSRVWSPDLGSARRLPR